MTKKTTKSQRHVASKRAKGLRQVTMWVPENSYDDFMYMGNVITDFYLEKGEFHQDLFPFMYRNIDTGVMGNKPLNEIKKKAGKQ